MLIEKRIRRARRWCSAPRHQRRRVFALLTVVAAATPPLHAFAQGDPGPPALPQSHSAARGWLELAQDQRSYRDRTGPLDLKQERQLEVIERSQRLDLRALQQRDARELERAERAQRLAPPGALNSTRVPARDAAADIRRRAERHRSNIRRQQQGLPFHRR